MKTFNKIEKAFTMLELVFVIIIIGILAVLALPRVDIDNRQAAIDNILAAIQHTQHLALIDDKTDPQNSMWQKELWTIKFNSDGGGSFLYSISSDQNHNGSVEKEETAVDPTNGGYIYDDGDGVADNDESLNIFLNRYGLTGMDFSSDCPADHLSFDRLGRLFSMPTTAGAPVVLFDGYKDKNCVITLSFSEGNDAIITIEAETGYAH